MQVETSPELLQADEIRRWRREQLTRSGFEPWLAGELAGDARLDLHALIELVERGCPAPRAPGSSVAGLDEESRAWLRDLRESGAVYDDAVARLHALLLRAARFEVARRRPGLPHLRGGDLDDISLEAADDALVSVLRRLDDFRGLSRFTTWAYKFALLEAAVKLRQLAWQSRELPTE